MWYNLNVRRKELLKFLFNCVCAFFMGQVLGLVIATAGLVFGVFAIHNLLF
jgi:hypothetical protein